MDIRCPQCEALVLRHRATVKVLIGVDVEILDAVRGGKSYETLLGELELAHQECAKARESLLEHYLHHAKKEH
jgi:hypothetical protein